MISSNNNAIMSILNDGVRVDAKPTLVGFKTVYLGNDKYPLSIIIMALIGSAVWKKINSFKYIASIVR